MKNSIETKNDTTEKNLTDIRGKKDMKIRTEYLQNLQNQTVDPTFTK